MKPPSTLHVFAPCLLFMLSSLEHLTRYLVLKAGRLYHTCQHLSCPPPPPPALPPPPGGRVTFSPPDLPCLSRS